jgi:hypothetical protein
MTDETRLSPTPFKKVLGWVVAIIGFALGRAAPIGLLMAAGGMGLVALLSRRLRPTAQPMRPSLIFQGGVLFATMAGSLLTLTVGQQFPTSAILDWIVSGAGLIWLVIAPGILPVLLLTLYQLVAISGNLFTVFGTVVNASTQATGIIAVLMRGAGVALMFAGLREIRKQTIAREVKSE